MGVVVVAMLGLMLQVVQTELAPQEDQGVLFTYSKAPDHANIEYLNKYTAAQTDIYRSFGDVYETSFRANGFGGPTVAFSGMLLSPSQS